MKHLIFSKINLQRVSLFVCVSFFLLQSTDTYSIELIDTSVTEEGLAATLTDTIAPILNGVPEDLVLECGELVPPPADVWATDNCGDGVTIEYSEVTTAGNSSTEGTTAQYVLTTPQAPVCTANEDGWALKLFDFPGYEFFNLLANGLFVEYDNGTAHITGTLVAQNNANAFLTMDVWLGNALSWEDWSTQSFPTSFKDDCDIITDEYLDYTYYLITEGSSTLTGAGDLAGSFISLSHAPLNNYYAYQLGLAGNNVNANFGGGSWFYGTGTLVDAVTNTTTEMLDFQGSFAFDAISSSHTIQRTWTATDACGNSSSSTQTISVMYPLGNGDYNYDYLVNVVDLSGFLSDYGTSGCGMMGDFNGDGEVSVLDLSSFLSIFGNSY